MTLINREKNPFTFPTIVTKMISVLINSLNIAIL